MTPDEAGLWRGVLAAPADDLPRLVYADYLEDTGRQPLAAFVRAQIALSQVGPAHPDYPDLVEAQALATAAVRAASSLPVPALPDGVRFAGSVCDFEQDGYGHYRRGFPASVHVDRIRAGRPAGPSDLDRVVTRTTARHARLRPESGAAFETVMAAPRAGLLTGLSFGGHGDTLPARIDRVGRSGVGDGLTDLFIDTQRADLADVTAALAAARFANLARLGVGHETREPAEFAALARAPWLPRLTHLGFRTGTGVGPDRVFGALDGSAALRVLRLGGVVEPWEDFPRLPRLEAIAFDGLTADAAAAVTRAGLPPVGRCAVGRAANSQVFWSPWLDAVRVLTVGTAPPAAAPAARSVRLLHVTGCPPAELRRLADPAFAAVTTLRADPLGLRGDGGDEAQAFAEGWSNPGLRSLTLDGWTLGNAGALRLARNPSFAGLRRLKLRGCKISDAGARALFESPHLANLVELDLAANAMSGKAALALADPGCLPRLVLADLTGNRLPADARTALRDRRPGVWA